MPSITKSSKGYRAQVYVRGKRDSATFASKREASNWAARRETELRDDASKSPGEKYTLADALRKYGEEVSPHKRGVRWEEVRIAAMLKDGKVPPEKRLNLPVDKKLKDLTPDDFGQWRNARLLQVTPGTVLREFSLLSAVLETARREWQWIPSNPIKDVRKPAEPDHRTVLITRAQIRAMLTVMGYKRGQCRSVSQACALAFLVALRTGMRAGEICGLTWDRVHDGYCALPVTKTVPRDVPLTPKTMRLIEFFRGYDPVLVCGLKSQSLDANFRKYRERAGLEGFTFHDTRHTAATWLAQRLHVLDLCKVMGWKNPAQAMVYYNPKASDIAKRISRQQADQSR